jgi:hypothetical protein
MADAVQATNLGTVQKQSVRTIRKGETAEFTILFWNLDEPVLPVKLKLRQAPEKWTVIINPEVFTLNQSKPENPPYQEGVEYIGASNNLIIRTTPIKIYVKVPTSAKEGAYEILITANAGTTNDAISVLQERTFKFVVNVKKSSTFFDTFANIGSAALEFSGDVADKITDSLSQSEVENKISKITEGVKLLTGKLAENISFNIFYVIISVCILVVSLIIYKYA